MAFKHFFGCGDGKKKASKKPNLLNQKTRKKLKNKNVLLKKTKVWYYALENK